MEFEVAYERIPGDGWLTKEEARLLWKYAKSVGGPILEVGCYKGRSSVLLAQADTTKFLHCVDPFKNFSEEDPTGDTVRNEFLDNIATRNIRNVLLHNQPIEVWNPRPVKLAYLDGDHTKKGTLAQIKKALQCDPLVIAIHDVNDSGDGLEIKQAAISKLGEWTERVERLAVWRLKEE